MQYTCAGFVLHYHVPPTLIRYYQEIGRAGRDGSTAWCILLYNPEDLAIQEHLIDQERPHEESYRLCLSILQKQQHGMSINELLLATGLSSNAIRTLLADLENQGFIQADRQRHYTLVNTLLYDNQQHEFPHLDFSAYEASRKQKLQELYDVRTYAEGQHCYMASLLEYVGNRMQDDCGTCGVCRKENFPIVQPTERMQARVAHFLDEEYLPSIEQRNDEHRVLHLGGWSLSFHGMTSKGTTFEPVSSHGSLVGKPCYGS